MTERELPISAGSHDRLFLFPPRQLHSKLPQPVRVSIRLCQLTPQIFVVPRQGFPCCHVFHLVDMLAPLPRRERPGAFVACFPDRRRPPLIQGGSAPALPFSRPARRSLAFRPACSLSRPRRPFDTKALQSTSLPPQTALAATNRSDNCRVGFAPTRKTRLSTAHLESQARSPASP